MRRTPRSVKALALLLGLGLFAAACGDDGDSSSDTAGGAGTTAAAGAGTTAAAEGDRVPTGGTITLGAEQWPECINPITQCANSSWMIWTTSAHVNPGLWETTGDGGFEPTALLAEEPTLENGGITEDPFTLTLKLNPDAVWEDGTPITSADIDFTWRAIMDTTGSVTTAGYEVIESIDTTDPQTAVIVFQENYAAYKNLFFPLLKAAAFPDTTNLENEMADNMPFSSGPWLLESWSLEQAVLVPNPNYYDESKTPLVDRVVMVPLADQDTELAGLLSGQVDAIFPQPAAGTEQRLTDSNIDFTFGLGTQYENLWIQQQKGPFSDPILREAFVRSVDTTKIIDTIYKPIDPNATQNGCMIWVPTIGDWCDTSLNEGLYDPEAAAALLEENGWAKGSDGIWAKGDQRATIRFAVNTGNTRRENTQALLIPDMKEKGFELVVDNSDAATYFQQRLPTLDTELAMYIQTATPDPTPTGTMSCDAIPTPENPSGQNNSGYCNEEASAVMIQSDQELDETVRVEQIHQVGKFMADDFVMVPLIQFPTMVAWRTDRIAGPIDADVSNYLSAFRNLYDWTVVS